MLANTGGDMKRVILFFTFCFLISSLSCAQYCEKKECINGVEVESYFEEREVTQEDRFPCWDDFCLDCGQCKTSCDKKPCKSCKSCEGECTLERASAWDEDEKSYRLKIGDHLFVSLYGFGEGNTTREVVVDPTGHIVYLFSGSVYALGKPIDQFRLDLQEKIREQFPNIIVAVSATNLIGEQYTVMGEVRDPGTKRLHGYTTVLTAMGESGGFPIRKFRNHTIDYADLDHAFLARDGEYVPVDFDALIRKGDLSQNVRLESGDYIHVPSILTKEVYVLGEVKSPLVYSYLRTATLTEAIAWSNGLTPLASTQVIIIRGSLACPVRYLVNYRRIRAGCDRDFCLKPGDIVYVPARPFTNIREVFKSALRTFVASAAIEAGGRGFETIHPHAVGDSNGSNLFIPTVP